MALIYANGIIISIEISLNLIGVFHLIYSCPSIEIIVLVQKELQR